MSSINTKITIEKIKTAIGNNSLDEALELLSDLQISSLNKELPLLKARWKKYKENTRLNIHSNEQQQTQYNRLLKDTLDFVDSVEKEVGEEAILLQEIKKYLSERYQTRVSQKLAGRQPVNLKHRASGKGSSAEAQATFVDKVLVGAEIKQGITQTYQDAYGRLLIVGQPGAGKTTLMLQLALGLLEQNANEIPVLLNLATWHSDYGSLEKWLKELLWLELGVSKTLARQLIETHDFILLLDGLDEVEAAHRASCLEAIGRYGATAKHRYVISSRIEEYQQVLQDAPVHWQIEVSPLSKTQIEQELQRMGREQPEVMPLLYALEQDDLLRQAIEIPFYFNTAQILFSSGKKLSDLAFTATDLEGRKAEILDRFVQAELQTTKEREYPPKQTKKWLAFLAKQMKKEQLVYFELLDLQPEWWERGNRINAWYGLLVGLLYGLIFGILFFLNYEVVGMNDFTDGVLQGILLEIEAVRGEKIYNTFLKSFGYWLLLGYIIIGVTIGILSAILVKVRKIKLSKLIFNLTDSLIIGLLFNSLFVLLLVIVLLILTIQKISLEELFEFPAIALATILHLTSIIVLIILFYELIHSTGNINTSEKISWSKKIFINQWKSRVLDRFLKGTRQGTFFWFIVLVLILIFAVSVSEEFEYSEIAKQSVLRLILYSIGCGILTGVIFSLSGFILSGFTKADFLQVKKPYQRFRYSLKNLNFAIFKHWTFRYLLYREGVLPLRLVYFLEEMSKRHLLESEGGRWRFRHRLIQEYFEQK